MYLSAETTALRIAIILKRSAKTKARFSTKTIKLLAKRDRLRTAFVTLLRDCLEQLGIGILELDRGGFGVFETSFLEGAPTLTARKHLPRDERQSVTDEDLYLELEMSEPEADEDD